MFSKMKFPYKDIVEIAAAFLVAWLFYQLLGIVTGSSQPVVSVVSSSMEHSADFDTWWARNGELYKQNGISKERFMNFPMPNGLYIGDILFIVASDNYNVGDIIVYHPGPGCFSSLRPGDTIIHRIIKKGDVILTKGDNPANAVDRCEVEKSRVVGRAVFVAPLLGYPRTILHDVIGI